MRRSLSLCCLFVSAVMVLAPAAYAGEVEKSFDFELGKWIELETKDGPVTLHRFQITESTSAVTKSRILRPGRNVAYTADLDLRLEYSNEATHDWKAQIEVEWFDGNGEAIDGYTSKEDLDEDNRHDILTSQQSTLRYGVERAKKVRLRITFVPE